MAGRKRACASRFVWSIAALTWVGCTVQSRALLRYESLGARRLDLPLVSGTIAGRATKMIVDTGAQTTSVDETLARTAGLEVVTTTERATAAGEESFPLQRVDHPQIGIEHWAEPSLRDLPALIVRLPDVLTRLGIGAVLSPQRISNGGVIVIDFLHGTLSRVGPKVAERRLQRVSGIALVGRRCTTHAGGIEGISFSIPATIDGEPSALTVDTGANRTTIFDRTPVGALLGTRAEAEGHVGTAAGVAAARVVRQVSFAIAGTDVAIDVTVAPGARSEDCGTDGQLGMDVLRRCVLALTDQTLKGACEARH